jgi:hypothetical protein
MSKSLGLRIGSIISSNGRKGDLPPGFAVHIEDGWSVLHTAAVQAAADSLSSQLGKPGLWKCIRTADGSGGRRVFELPSAVWQTNPDPEEEAQSDFQAWALQTAAGRLPEGWQPPPRTEVEMWIPPAGLTVQAGPLVRQGELIHRPDRLALRWPILSAVPANLSPGRRDWLQQLLLDGQDRWRMVRLGLEGEEASPAAVAEVDFSGCPPVVLQQVFGAGLGALRWVVEWLVRSADLLADPGALCRAVEVRRMRA